ncbi:hypothetical protein FACS1894111_07420 [Clostridia bacterium]|nr:hypothetical protein FACS1894111_07420 [Clostridia bacterium]
MIRRIMVYYENSDNEVLVFREVMVKKKLILVFTVIFVFGLCTACGKSIDVKESTLIFHKNGSITGAIREKLEKNYYSGEELQTYINQRISDYTAEHGKNSVKLSRFATEGQDVAAGEVIADISYASYEDYAGFNEIDLYMGTIPQALAAGYDLSGSFQTTDASKDQPLTDGKLPSDAKATSGLKMIALNEAVNVKVPGSIYYVSAEHIKVLNKDTAQVVMPEGMPEGSTIPMTYIIYK